MVCEDLGGWWDVALLQLSHDDFQRLIDGGVTLGELEPRCLDSTSVDDDTLCVDVFADWREGRGWQDAKRQAVADDLRKATGTPKAAARRRITV